MYEHCMICNRVVMTGMVVGVTKTFARNNDCGWVVQWTLAVQCTSALGCLRLVGHHTYCYGCEDKYILVLPTVSNPTDILESHSVPHWNSTKINHSTSRLIFLPNYRGTTLHVPRVKPSTRFRSLYVIQLCFYLFLSPNYVITKLGQFIFSYSLTQLF